MSVSKKLAREDECPRDENKWEKNMLIKGRRTWLSIACLSTLLTFPVGEALAFQSGASRPEHVDLRSPVILPTDQRSALVVHRELQA